MGKTDRQRDRIERIERKYRELLAVDPETHRACVESAEAIAINYHRALEKLTADERLALIADIEQRLISVALTARSQKEP